MDSRLNYQFHTLDPEGEHYRVRADIAYKGYHLEEHLGRVGGYSIEIYVNNERGESGSAIDARDYEHTEEIFLTANVNDYGSIGVNARVEICKDRAIVLRNSGAFIALDKHFSLGIVA